VHAFCTDRDQSAATLIDVLFLHQPGPERDGAAVGLSFFVILGMIKRYLRNPGTNAADCRWKRSAPRVATLKRKGRTMAKRVKSHDGHRETDDILGAGGQISQAGRGGGRLARDIGTKDELKRAAERPAGVTRVKKADEKEGEA